jgi:hypothetical protein
MRLWKQKFQIIIFAVLVVLAVPAVAMAAQSASTHYQVSEAFFGSGGELHSCSTNFCSKQSAGELAVGATCSTAYCAQAGFNTDRTPYIQFIVSNNNSDLGTLTSSATKTATATFAVKAYLSHGYAVINASDPPTNTSYTMHALTTPTASIIGDEQFGFNLVANTSPTNFGSDPQHAPDNTFSFGQVAADYGAQNFYKYHKGDTVAYSNSSSSATTYTASYIFNISDVTPGGTYTMRHVLVATATY